MRSSYSELLPLIVCLHIVYVVFYLLFSRLKLLRSGPSSMILLEDHEEDEDLSMFLNTLIYKYTLKYNKCLSIYIFRGQS